MDSLRIRRCRFHVKDAMCNLLQAVRETYLARELQTEYAMNVNIEPTEIRIN